MKKLFILVGLMALTPVHAEMSMKDFASIDVTVKNIKTERGGQLVVFVFTEHGFPQGCLTSWSRFNGLWQGMT